jgi:hypothetical protein
MNIEVRRILRGLEEEKRARARALPGKVTLTLNEEVFALQLGRRRNNTANTPGHWKNEASSSAQILVVSPGIGAVTSIPL